MSGRQIAELVGVYDKLDRARSHLVDVELECARVDRLYREATEGPEVEGSDYVWRIHAPPIPRLDFAVIVGDAIHNLRCAVDHLAHALVEISEDAEPTNWTSFPILKTEPGPGRDGLSLPNISGGVDDEIRVVLDEVQPYKRSKPHLHHLWLLHRLDIIDKHRKLLVSVTGLGGLSWWGEASEPVVNSGPYEDGDVVCRFRIDEPDLAPDFKAQVRFRLRLDEEDASVIGTYRSVADFGELLAKYVEDWLVPKFVPFFQ